MQESCQLPCLTRKRLFIKIGLVYVVEPAVIILSSLSMAISLFVLVLVFAWRKTTPETSDLRKKYLDLSMAQTDIVDKLNKWMARDDARHARSGKKKRKVDDEEEFEVVEATPPPALTRADQKALLRARLLANRGQV